MGVSRGMAFAFASGKDSTVRTTITKKIAQRIAMKGINITF